MVNIKENVVKRILAFILALCFILTASSCSKVESATAETPENKPAPVSHTNKEGKDDGEDKGDAEDKDDGEDKSDDEEKDDVEDKGDGEDKAESEDKDIGEATAVEMYDLVIYIPEKFEWNRFSGAEKYVTVDFELDDYDSISWLSVSPQRVGLDHTADFETTMTDNSGIPVLTAETVTSQYGYETVVRAVLEEGEITVGGISGAYIEVELFSEAWPEEIWQVRLSRAIYDGIAYDFIFASLQDRFVENLPLAEGIIASAKIGDEKAPGEAEFWGIKLSYPTNGIKATVSDAQVYILNSRAKDSSLSFYLKHDNTVLYTDELLSDQAQLDRLLRIWSYDVVNHNYRKFMNPLEISREETEINGKRALRVVYHDALEDDPYGAYVDILLFVHNYDLYILKLEGEVGYEDALHSFTQPIIDSITFDKTVNKPPAERPMPYSDTVRWITDTYAILSIINGEDLDLVGGRRPTISNAEFIKETLVDGWGITDRETSDEVINSLYKSGHRAKFRQFARESGIFTLAPNEFEAMIKESPEELKTLKYIYDNTREAYNLRGDKAILAWDYCRIIFLYCTGYIAGYYTYSEALDLSLPIALKLQSSYSSWDDMYRDYMAGFHFWRPGDVNDPSTENYSRTQIMLNLAASPDGAVPWGTRLTADWRAGEQE